MRTPLQGTIRPVRVAVGLTLLMLVTGLTGCAAGLGAAPPLAPAPAPDHTVIAGVGDEIVLLNCEMFVPIPAVAEVLGVAVADVAGQYYPPATPSAGAATVAMAAQAVRAAGGQQCRYVLAGAADDAEAGAAPDGPAVVVTVLPNAAAEFGRIEPDVNDGLNNMVPASLGDASFSACRDGEWQGCRAEVLTGTTWLSISVQTPDPDPAAFQDYATGVVDSLAALKFAQPPRPARPECGTLVSPHDLTESGALVDATGGDTLVLDNRGSQAVAAEVRGGLVGCSWTGGSAADSGYGGVALTILPGADGLWGHTPPAELPTHIALQPVDLADEPGARWPASGVNALAGCAAEQCQVTLMADGVWLTATTTGAAGLPGATALAAVAYARYTGAV